MKRVNLFLVFSFFFISIFSLNAQLTEPFIRLNDPQTPEWFRMMALPGVNVFQVDSAYSAYYKTHIFEKNTFTKYYKRWRRAVQAYMDGSGLIHFPSEAQRKAVEKRAQSWRQSGAAKSDNQWSFAGPDVHYAVADSLFPISEQANTYTIDRSLSNPDILYCGTESGGVYKSTDAGHHWIFMTANLLVNTITAIRVHPTNPDIAFFGAAGKLFETTDGGLNWNPVGQPSFQNLSLNFWEIHFHPNYPDTMYAATDKGLYRSADAGANWVQILSNQCMTLEFKPDDPSVVYTIQFNPALNYSQFYKSTDFGQTFELKESGWFAPAPENAGLIENQGGDLAITQADPNRIYALLVGYGLSGSTVQTNGFIGVYVSYDAGETWSLPHGLIGTPYSPAHPNLMNFSGDDGDYSQIYYNTTMVASQLNPDKVLIGGLSLWRTDDAAATYIPQAGYVGYVPYVHVDMQELRIYKTSDTTEEIWLSNDGGIHHSNDFMETHESRTRGVYGGEFWGFDQGWNDDIMVGGRYHNGNAGYYENYPAREFLSLGGGEAATGYVNYSDERKTYFSDIGGRILPEDIEGDPVGFNISLQPNESYVINSSSRILFDRRYWNVAYLGKDNKLYKSTDGGSSYTEWHSFGNNTGNLVLWFEQNMVNPDVMYVQQAIGNLSTLWKTGDGGASWVQVSMPHNDRNLFFTIGSDNPNEVWVAYTYQSNGNKVYHTTDGGLNWTNLTSPLLNNTQIWAIAHQAGTNGGVYLGVLEGGVFYRNNDQSDWTPYSNSLPVACQPLRLVPFYRDGKIRLATWNLSIWEAPLYEPSHLIADFATATPTFYCPGDTVTFVDHSVASANAIWHWSFPGGTPATSTEKYPKVSYASSGTYDVTLIVTDGVLSDTVVKSAYIGSIEIQPLPLAEGFESGYFDPYWKFNHPTGGGTNWAINNGVGGFGTSTRSISFDNYNIDTGGAYDEVWTAKYDCSQHQTLELTFDVSYAEYGFPYSDSLAVLVSTDCGASFTQEYLKGGDDLQTAPDFQDYFVPDATQWRTDSINLSDYAGYPELLIAFQNRGRFGNVIYLDNINLDGQVVSGSSSPKPETELLVYPNPSHGSFEVRAKVKQSDCTLRIINALGQLLIEQPLTAVGGQVQYTVSAKLAAGHYQVQLVSGKEVMSQGVEVY